MMRWPWAARKPLVREASSPLMSRTRALAARPLASKRAGTTWQVVLPPPEGATRRMWPSSAKRTFLPPLRPTRMPEPWPGSTSENWRRSSLVEPGQGSGILVGRRGGKNVLFAEDGHILLVAPSGGGKTTCHVVPALFDASGLAASALVLDIKGELASLTSGFRAAHGHRIIRHNPAEQGEDLARYNPLWRVRPERAVQDAQLVAQDLVPATPSDPFWGVAARQFVTGLVLHILSSAEEKSLGSCYDFLTDTLPLEKRLGAMLKSNLRVVSGAARSLLDMADKTRSSVLATATAALGL